MSQEFCEVYWIFYMNLVTETPMKIVVIKCTITEHAQSLHWDIY